MPSIVEASMVLATQLLDSNTIISEVNKANVGWVAGENKKFAGAKLEDVKRLMGFKPTADGITSKLPWSELKPTAQALPMNFSSAVNWPACTSIGSIQDQGECGSCWAFGCVEAVTDRFCIASNGTINIPQLSEQQMTSCGPCDGCQGGEAGTAWDYVSFEGLVTGTDYPYTQPTCAPVDQPCEPNTFKPTERCKKPAATLKHYKVDKVTRVRAADMQQEIFTNGPIEVCFTVYNDFLNYKSGVYRHVTGKALGGHCVKAVGWGEEGGEKYWLINNSWTTTWGDMGQFKILRGVNACGIEGDAVAGAPVL